MDTRELYCPACDRTVVLEVTDSPPRSGQANLPDGGDLVCLGYEGECAGTRCALTGAPGIVMAYRLARSHRRDERWPLIRGRCAACDRETELELLDEMYAFCTLCERTSLRAAIGPVRATGGMSSEL